MVTKTTKTTKRTKKVEEPTTGIIAIDNGGHYTKILSETMSEPVSLSSKKAHGHDRLKTKSRYEVGTYKIVHEGKIYFMGALMDEGEGEMTSFTNTKTTKYFILSILQACALYGYEMNKVITCTPFSRYTDEEEEKITKTLLGEHEIEINDKTYSFAITDVIVAPEVTPAYFVDEPEGKVHWLDIGSRTVGFSTTKNDGEIVRTIEKETGTLEGYGLDQYNPRNMESYASMIANGLLKHHWKNEEPVVVFGGGVDFYPDIATELEVYFPNITVGENPRFLQVEGMLKLGQIEFSPVDDEEEDE